MLRPYILAIFRGLQQLPEDGQDIWPKHAGVLYNEYKTLCNYLVVNLCVKIFVFSVFTPGAEKFCGAVIFELGSPK
jgi:hypothetical protein